MTQKVENPRVSAVIVSYKTGPSLRQCIDSVLSDADVHEVILVDNGNPKHERRLIADSVVSHPKLRIVQGHGNVGFAKACNYGAYLAKGEMLVFLNPDAVLTEGAIKEMQGFARTLDEPWIIGGMLKDVHGNEQRGGRRRELTPLSAFTAFTGLSKLPFFQAVHMEREPLPKEPQIVHIISGAFMMMNRASFDRVKGFDEDFFLHVEDIDICRRVREAGGTVYFHPHASVMHYGSTSHATRFFVEWEKLKGFVHYFRKFSGKGTSRILSLLAIPFMAAAIMGRASVLTLQQRFRRS